MVFKDHGPDNPHNGQYEIDGYNIDSCFPATDQQEYANTAVNSKADELPLLSLKDPGIKVAVLSGSEHYHKEDIYIRKAHGETCGRIKSVQRQMVFVNLSSIHIRSGKRYTPSAKFALFKK